MTPNRFLASRWIWLGWMFAATVASRGHDQFEITTVVQMREHILEIEVTMARSTALAVGTGRPEAPTFEPADFPRHQAMLVAAAPRLFRITAGGRPLMLQSARASLGREHDVDFHLVYPAPRTGPLRVEALHLARLPEGHGNVLAVRDVARAPIGTALLNRADPALEIALPVPPPAVPIAAGAGARAAFPVLAAILAALAGSAWALRRRIFKSANS